MKKIAMLAIVATALFGCAQPDLSDPQIFGRIDCKRGDTDPVLKTKYEQDAAICKAKAEAQAAEAQAEISGAAGGVAYGIGGAIAKDVQMQRVAVASVKACMADAGYLYMKRSEHVARCASRR